MKRGVRQRTNTEEVHLHFLHQPLIFHINLGLLNLGDKTMFKVTIWSIDIFSTNIIIEFYETGSKTTDKSKGQRKRVTIGGDPKRLGMSRAHTSNGKRQQILPWFIQYPAVSRCRETLAGSPITIVSQRKKKAWANKASAETRTTFSIMPLQYNSNESGLHAIHPFQIQKSA